MIFLISFISAVPPVTTEFVGTEGFAVEANVQPYYVTNEGAEVHIYVFNMSNGAILASPSVSCQVELTDHNGSVVLEGSATPDDHHFHMVRPPNVVNTSETYALTIVCNNSYMAGYKTAFFEANPYGAGLTEAESLNFNWGMMFLMILFITSFIGIFKIESPAGKLACYWFSHLIFIVGTFSIWQFNYGHTLEYSGLAGAFKVLFYVSTISVFPMILLSIAWMFYIHTMNDDIKKMIDRGMDEDEAYSRAKEKKKW